MRTQGRRDANLDLLRIVSMLLIILLHSIDHSGVLEQAELSSDAMYAYVRFAYAATQVCVNCYVMLSGYYLVNSTFRLQKLAALWMETAFYAFALKLLFVVTGREPFSALSLLSCFFPIVTGRYWFITIYVGLYLVSPFLNKLIHAMNKREHTLLNICLAGLFSLWSSLHPSIVGMNSGGGWGLAWFVVLYLLAAWFRLYYRPSTRPLRCFVVFLAIPCIVAILQAVLGGGTNIPARDTILAILANWFRYDSLPVYLMTLALFAAFLNMRIKEGRCAAVICKIAPLTLGVYLIHAHANVSPWSWAVLDLPSRMDSAAFPLIQLGCVLGIFMLCIAIDAIRKATIGRLEHARCVERLCGRLSQAVTAPFHRDR